MSNILLSLSAEENILFVAAVVSPSFVPKLKVYDLLPWFTRFITNNLILINLNNKSVSMFTFKPRKSKSEESGPSNIVKFSIMFAYFGFLKLVADLDLVNKLTQ